MRLIPKSRNFALSTVARKTHVVIYGITSKIDSDRSFHHPSVAADCVVAVILKIHFYSFLSYFLSSRFLLVCLSFRSAGRMPLLPISGTGLVPQRLWRQPTPGRGARNGAVVGRIPPIPLRPSRLAFNRLGSSSLCVGDHYCSLRRQVSPLYY
jgi:hypothetical protein